MTVSLPDLDFHQIRPYGQPPSRASGFEELASILIELGAVEWPAGTRFERFGAPDGGREGRGVLLNGDVWAWQAKYLFEFDNSAARQATDSVRRALDTEPRLRRYFVSMPFDLPAGDTEDRDSAHTKWTGKIVEWERLAASRGREVQFEFVGAHRLVTALTQTQNAGRARYWFGASTLAPEWERRRLEEAIAKAGRRYTPKLHVDVDTVQVLHAVGRVGEYADRWRLILASLRESRRWRWPPPADLAALFAGALASCERALDVADKAIEGMIAAAQSEGELPIIDEPIEAARRALDLVQALLQQHALSKDGYYVGDAASLYTHVEQASGAMWRGTELTAAPSTAAATKKALMLTGRAGVGKTHLLCDVAGHRIADGRPTILLLGQDFDGRALLDQIGERTQTGGSADDVLALLDAAGEAARSIGLLMIDAVNESERPERWRDDCRALVAAAARYPYVGVVLSCRTEYLDQVIGDLDTPTVEHVGFAEATDVAVARFALEFGLEPPTFPVLNPEFGNPLFLKLTCEALETLGATRFTFGSAGLTTVIEAFLNAVNRRLSESSRCDYDEHNDLVGRVVLALARIGRGPFPREDVRRLADEALPGKGWSKSLLRGLIAEGVLMDAGDGRVSFGYQRLGDVARARAIAESSLDDVRSWLAALGRNAWRERGVLGALAVIAPERHAAELIDLALDGDGRVPVDVVDAFVESLILRSPQATSARAVELVERLLDHSEWRDQIWDRLVRIACVPDHSLNARYLHRRLSASAVADRDLAWSVWLDGAMDADEESAVRRLIEWAWPHDLGTRRQLPADVGELATLALGWLLAGTDRRVRDRATKALVSVGERAASGFAKGLAAFRGVNDPYVAERLAAAACAVVLRYDDPAASCDIADGAAELVRDEWPTHLLTRDYLRRVADAARSRGWTGDAHTPPYGADWPVTARPIEEIEALAGPPAYAYGSVWHSVSGGDFGRYVLEPSVRDVVTADNRALVHLAERAVFDRVLDLGWTPERFGDVERGRGFGRDGPVERFGKKYQWIGLYEVLGRLADNSPIRESWGAEPSQYERAEQLVWRDIDPTVLARKGLKVQTESVWFSPVAARFAVAATSEYPSSMDGVPDPIDLIALVDESGRRWLGLVSQPTWEQALAPEVEALRPPRLAMWMDLQAHLIPIELVPAFSEWANERDLSELGMPSTPEVHSALLAAHPDDPKWSAADGRADPWEATAAGWPIEPIGSAAWYGGTGTSRDASAEEETLGYVPTKRMLDILGLKAGVDFVWSDRIGVAVSDPSVLAGGPSSLVVRRDLCDRLAANGLTLFWTVRIGNELHHRDLEVRGEEYRWVGASAAYVLIGDGVQLVASRADRWMPGPTTERRLRWTPKEAEQA